MALVVMALVTCALAAIFSSPDEHPVTIRQWAQGDPGDFLATSVTELDGSSPTATYGPPYNPWTSGEGQKIGPFGLQRWVGVHIPVNTPERFRPGAPARGCGQQPVPGCRAGAILDRVRRTNNSSGRRRTPKVSDTSSFHDTAVVLPAGGYGPVAPMMSSLLNMARTGSLDAVLLASPQFYGTDYTKPLLFIADGSFLSAEASTQHLQGDQWGMMNETGNYPGQAWLWLYTMWYQVPPFSTSWSANADALVWALMMLLTLVLLLVPFIPGLRSVPRYVPVYRLIWRAHYRRLAAERQGSPDSG